MMGVNHPVDFVKDLKPSLARKIRILPRLLSTLVRLLSRFARIDLLYAGFNAWFETEYQRVDRQRLHLLDGAELMALAIRTKDALLSQWTTPIINDFFVMMMNGKVVRTLK